MLMRIGKSTFLTTVCLLVISSGVTLFANSQTNKRNIPKDAQVHLVEALKMISKVYDTRFIYERTLLSNILVNADERYIKSNRLDILLEDLLAPHDLSYHLVSKDYYMIVKKGRVAGNSQDFYPVDTIRPRATSLQVKALITGTVTESGSSKPIEGAIVQLVQYGLISVTNAKGYFTFNEVPVSKTRVIVHCISMVSLEEEVSVQTGGNQFDFRLKPNAFNLKEVQVVARESHTGATTSTITKTAIEHLQATSLADVMQLLPGAVVKNPDFSNVNQFAVRQVGTDNTGSLGTSVIINGVPVSNNANLQMVNTATSSTLAGFSTSSGGGVDYRQISADNIESVEVIRGIPSVEYGDLTSGAVIVNTKAGVEPFQLKARVNPRITQLWAGKGFSLGKKGGTLFADVDYTKATDDQRYEYSGYSRVTGDLQYSKTLFTKKPLYTVTGFSYGMNLDEQKQDPDDYVNQEKRKAQDYGFRFNTSGKWNLKQKFARMLTYTFSVNYAIQKGFQQQLASGAIYPLSSATKDTTMAGQYLPSQYLSQVWIDGKPLNVFAKVADNFFIKSGIFNHRLLLGAEWKTDVNLGAGKTYDVNRPPKMSDGNASRPRSYKDIPALNQLSFYAEDNITATIFQRHFSFQAGLRYDNVQPNGIWNTHFGTAISPRFNFSYEVFRKFLVRAGYGTTSKAPTLAYLYPEKAYFDLVNFNYYAADPAERLVMITTKVFDTENRILKLARGNKKEVGFDWNIDRQKRLTVTAFYETVKNGYEYSTTAESIHMVPLAQYKALTTPAGQPPVLDPVPLRIDTAIATYMTPTNNRHNTNKGVEFDFEFGRIDAIRTSFVLNGAWINSKSVSDGYYFLKRQVNGSDPSKVAVYATGRGTESERASTTLRIIHNIPQLRFIVTLAIQTVWSEKNKYLGYSSTPVAYVDRGTGKMVTLSAQEQSQITAANTELYTPVSNEYYVTESWKPIWLYNLRLTKEIGKNMGFSFFANNVFNYNPLQESNRWKGQYTQRNPILFFGTEVNIKL